MKNSDLYFSLEELRSQFKRQEDSFMIGRDIAKSILVFSTAMLSVVLSITSLKNPILFEDKCFLILTGVVGVVFIAIIILSISLLIPAPLLGPIEPREENFQKHFFGRTETDVLNQLIADYISVINQNTNQLKKRNKIAKIEGALMIIVVLCVALMIAV